MVRPNDGSGTLIPGDTAFASQFRAEEGSATGLWERGRGLSRPSESDSLEEHTGLRPPDHELEIPPMRDVLRHLIELLERDGEPIVCQVAETRGSTPQKAGSMMVIDPDGGQGGTLGGGCVENEVKSKAIQQIGKTNAAVHSFVLDHDYAWADGLICGGKMVIVTQPACGPGPLAYFREMDRMIEDGRGFTEAIVIDGADAADCPIGSRFLFDGEGRLRDRLADRRCAGRIGLADHTARRSAQTVGKARLRTFAELAAHSAPGRGGRARRPGRRPPRRASRI